MFKNMRILNEISYIVSKSIRKIDEKSQNKTMTKNNEE